MSKPMAELGDGAMFDFDAEGYVLAACFDRPDIVHDIRADLAEEHFGSGANRTLWRAIVATLEQHGDVSRVLVWGWLDDNGRVGDLGTDRGDSLRYLIRIADEMPDYSVRLKPFVDRLRDKARMRRLKMLSAKIRASVDDYCGDVQAFVERCVAAFQEVADTKEMGGMVHISTALREKFASWAKMRDGRVPSGFSTGFPSLDLHVGGFRAGNLIVLAARPGAGKSALALNMSMRMAQHGIAVAFFSLEMSKDELTDRQLADLSEVPVGLIKSANIHSATYAKNLDDAARALNGYPIWINDTSTVAMVDIRAHVKRLQTELSKTGGELGLVVVDYVGLMQEPPNARNREQAIAANTRDLKLLAKDCGVPVLLLAQMNRDIEKRSGRPRLSDLRESGALEQDADVVLFLHRTDSECVLVVAKNRHGGCGEVPLEYRGEITRFEEPEGYVGVGGSHDRIQ